MNTFPTIAAATTLVVTFALGGCSSDSKSSSVTATAAAAAASSSTAAAGAPVLTISNFQFSALTVAAGQEFTIDNSDSAKHTVTADDKSFSVAVPGQGSATLTIAKPGTYAIHCEIHSSMKGLIIVH